MSAPLDDLLQYGLVDLGHRVSLTIHVAPLLQTYVGNRDCFIHSLVAHIFHHVLDEDRAFRDFTLCKSNLSAWL